MLYLFVKWSQNRVFMVKYSKVFAWNSKNYKMSFNPSNLTLRIQSVSQSFNHPLLLRICFSLELRLIQNNRSRSVVQLPKNELRPASPSVILSILIRLMSGSLSLADSSSLKNAFCLKLGKSNERAGFDIWNLYFRHLSK